MVSSDTHSWASSHTQFAPSMMDLNLYTKYSCVFSCPLQITVLVQIHMHAAILEPTDFYSSHPSILSITAIALENTDFILCGIFEVESDVYPPRDSATSSQS